MVLKYALLEIYWHFHLYLQFSPLKVLGLSCLILKIKLQFSFIDSSDNNHQIVILYLLITQCLLEQYQLGKKRHPAGDPCIGRKHISP